MNISELDGKTDVDHLEASPASWELFRLGEIYKRDEKRMDLFVRALRENTVWHYARNPAYRNLCELEQFHPEQLSKPEDLARIPGLAAKLFKDSELAPPQRDAFLAVNSSGTGGKKTTVYLDPETVMRMWAMGRATFQEDGLVEAEPVHYLIFAPPPGAIEGHGNALFFNAMMEFAPSSGVDYALKVEDGAVSFDLENVKRAMLGAAASGMPVRLLGLPALMLDAAKVIQVKLPPRSLAITGGGWKGRMDVALPRDKFRKLLGEAWGLPDHRVRDLYGMTEHAVHYLECSEHRFHAPVFSQVRIVDPLSKAQMPAGEEGVVHLMNPGFTTMPVQSLFTSDAGRMIPNCACGRGTPAFEITRRVGAPELRGCAAVTLDRLAS